MVKPLTTQEVARYEQRLLAELAAHAEDVEAIERLALEPSGGERFQDVDESVEESALEAELLALRAEDALGYEAREALERIHGATFGRCEDCGRTIARRRLDLLPYARQCVRCARRGAREPVGRRG